MTLNFLMNTREHADKYALVNLWEGSIGSCRWLGQFPSDCIPEEYKKKLVVKFHCDGKDDEVVDRLTVFVE